MPEHEREAADEARFYPINGMRGHCECGAYVNYISREGEVKCDDCGRVWNVYVGHDLWQGPA